MTFDRVAILDWSSAGTPKLGADSIWLGVADSAGITVRNIATRAAAATALDDLVRDSMAGGVRLLLGVDFLLGYPAGFARALTGTDVPLAVWAWLADRITDDGRNRHNLRDVAALANGAFVGPGPFWGNGARRDVPGLTRTKPAGLPPGLATHRETELAARQGGAQPKTAWQLAGAGTVGAQALVGLPVLHRMRQAFAGQIAVWPFEDTDTAPVVLAEIYPSLLAAEVAAACAADPALVRDAAQVRLLASALLGLARSGGLGALWDAPPGRARAEEGWILGVNAPASAAGPGAASPLRAALGAAPARALSRKADLVPRSGAEPIPVNDALDRLRRALRPVTGSEICATHGAAGRILAAPVTASRAHPPRDTAAMDGWGFAHASSVDGPRRLSVLSGLAAAGRPFAGTVPVGSALRVLTGAILPDGVDTVVPDERIVCDGDAVVLSDAVHHGANIRRSAEDIAKGAQALPEGHRLRAPDLALLAAIGVAQMSVCTRLRVGVLSTGDEIVAAPDRPARAHQVWDANRPMLLALVAGWGHAAVDLGHAPDDAATIAQRLDDAAGRCDVILTSGGASAGEADHVPALLRARGALALWRVAMRPGKPMAFGQWNGLPVLCLPGNPVAALVCALIFGRPALSLMAGAGWVVPMGFTMSAAFSRSKPAGRREYLRARCDAHGAAEVFVSDGSARISGLGWATGLVELPDAACVIRPGTPVRFLPFAGFGI